MSQRFRNVCFTINNYTMEDYNLICQIDCSYVVIGYEAGEAGVDHMQGYIELIDQCRLKKLKQFLPRAHIESRKGSAKQASDYCKKDGNFIEEGILSNAGKRSDLEHIKEIIDNGGTMEDVANEHFGDFIRYKLEKYTNLKKKLCWEDCEVMIYNKMDIYDIVKDNMCFIGVHDDIGSYDGQEIMVLSYGYRDYIERFARNLSVRIKYGYEYKTIKPKLVVAWMPYLERGDNLIDICTPFDKDLL